MTSQDRARKRARLVGPTAPDTEKSCKSGSEMQELVEDFFGKYDTALGSTCAPASAHPEIASFINNLKIPCILGAPVLLLHDLGSGIVDQSVIDEVFNSGKSRLLVDNSGSGKTRLLFEGLCKHWGFYFTSYVHFNHRLGSRDIVEAIDQDIPNSKHFNCRLGEVFFLWRAETNDINHSIAKRHVHQVLTARILVFERFLKMIRDTFPSRPINEFKKHWLLLQLCSLHIFGTDVFESLSTVLKDASDDYLMIGDGRVHSKLLDLQKSFSLDSDFFFILDEAQIASRTLNGCFRSEHDTTLERSVLTPIVKTLSLASSFPIILSGDSLSIEVVNDVASSTILKDDKFIRSTNTGAFDNPKRQRDYIMRYMPGHIANTDSGQEFLRRAWNFARGRYQFTASLLSQLIISSFQSPHKVLDRYVKTACGFRPSDGRRFSEAEGDITRPLLELGPIDFSRIFEDSARVEVFSRLLYTWLIQRKLIELSNENKDLVELGFARFVDSSGETAVVDEPLVLLAAAHQLRHFIHPSLTNHVREGLLHGAGGDERFEEFIVYYLICAFGNRPRRLRDVFDFEQEDILEWAQHPAQLLSVVFDDRRTEGSSSSSSSNHHHSHQPDVLGRNRTILAFKSNDGTVMEETKKCFKSLSTLTCFPDNLSGPYVTAFFRPTTTSQVIAIVIQCKRTKPKPGPGDTNKAPTLDLLALPAAPIEAVASHGSLDIIKCALLIDQQNLLLEAVKWSFGISCKTVAFAESDDDDDEEDEMMSRIRTERFQHF